MSLASTQHGSPPVPLLTPVLLPLLPVMASLALLTGPWLEPAGTQENIGRVMGR